MIGGMRIVILIPATLLFALPATADDIAAGKRLAEINCARCHALGREGASPFKDAPPFRTIHENYGEGELEDAFNDGIAVAHPAMPDWTMTSDQARELAAFIMSFGPAKEYQ
jgi:mono/diheme cytochrome c family protein